MKRVRLIILLLAAVLLTGCEGALENVSALNGQQPEEKLLTIELLESAITAPETESEESTVQTPEPETEFDDPAQWTYAYDRLEDTAKSWYRRINAALLSMETTPTVLPEEGISGGLTEEDIDRIFQCVLLDHPEYFFVTGYQYTKYTRAQELVSIEFEGNYSMDRETALLRKEEIEKCAEEILAGVSPDADDYEKVRYIYETIIKNTEYDLNAPENQNIYSVLINKASVCQGYAKTVQLLLNRLGVPCTLVQGSVKEGEGHAWNLVLADGAYYYLDTTWGDASFQMESTENSSIRIPDISYDYLCVTTAELLKTHTLETLTEMPECTAIEDNYYVKEGCYFTAFEEEQMKRLLQRALAEGREEVYIKCAEEAVYNAFKQRLIEEGGIFDYLGDAYSTVAYVQNDNTFLLTFWVTNN